jgi:hypothetical protein
LRSLFFLFCSNCSLSLLFVSIIVTFSMSYIDKNDASGIGTL